MSEERPFTLAESVAEAYENAIEGGYDISLWSDEEVAADMIAYDDAIASAVYDAEAEKHDYEQVEVAVHQYRARRVSSR